jgi:hypothetical protein
LPGLLAPGPFEACGQYVLPSVRPFAPRCAAALLRPRLTSRSASRRRPFRREARPPQVRAPAFLAQPPDLRRLPLVARASRAIDRSPWSASPRIRFLFVGWRLRSPLPSATLLTEGHLAVRSGSLRPSPPEDLHLLVGAHAGRTTNRAPTALGDRGSIILIPDDSGQGVSGSPGRSVLRTFWQFVLGYVWNPRQIGSANSGHQNLPKRRIESR